MSNPTDILTACHRLGLKIWAEDDLIGIAPKQRIPPDLLEQIRASKPVLLPLLRESAHQLAPDQTAWLHVARQVLAAEFDGADRSTVASLIIGMRSIRHPLCRLAFKRLKSQPHATGDEEA